VLWEGGWVGGWVGGAVSCRVVRLLDVLLVIDQEDYLCTPTHKHTHASPPWACTAENVLDPAHVSDGRLWCVGGTRGFGCIAGCGR